MIEEITQVEDKFAIEDLQKIAHNAKAKNIKEVSTVEVNVEEVDKVSAEIVGLMYAAANEGQLEIQYSLKDGSPLELLHAVAAGIRVMYPRKLMIIKNEGALSLKLNWSGKNEV